MNKLYFSGIIAIIAGCFWGQGCTRANKNVSVQQKAPVLNCSNCIGQDRNSTAINAILTTYKQDGSEFITSQDYEYCVCNKSLAVSTTIADQRVIFKLHNNDFSIVNNSVLFEDSPLSVFNAEICSLIYEIFNTDAANFIETSEPVNIYGQWYKMVGINNDDFAFYQSINGGKVDMVVSQNYIAKGYHYRYDAIADRAIATKIEILNIGKGKSPGAKVLTIENKSVK